MIKKFLLGLNKNQKGGMNLEIVGAAFIGAGLLKKKPRSSEQE